jgi:hypothetical protein
MGDMWRPDARKVRCRLTPDGRCLAAVDLPGLPA